MNTGRAGPLEANRLEFLAERQHAVFANVESIVVEEKFFRLREHLVRLLEFAGYAVHRTDAPGVPGKRLRPETESTQSRTSARGVKGNVRIQQERNIVIFDFEMLLVNLGGEGQRIQLGRLQHGPRGIVHHFSVF